MIVGLGLSFANMVKQLTHFWCSSLLMKVYVKPKLIMLFCHDGLGL